MNEKRKAKLLFYVFIIQFISILFALLIEKITDLVVKKYNINLDMEILYLLFTLILAGLFMYIVYRQIHSLLLFEPISSQISSSNERKNFYDLLKRVQNKQELTDSQKSKLQYYIDRSVLPSDFINRQTDLFHLNIWKKMLLVVTIAYLFVAFKVYINEHHRNNEQVS